MATASTRTTSIKTPGIQSAESQDSAEELDTAAEGGAALNSVGVAEDPAPVAAMPADLAEFIKAEIAKGIAAGMAAMRPAAPARTASAELPSEEKAMKQVKSSGRAILSTAGYVCPLPEDTVVQRDASGFSKV